MNQVFLQRLGAGIFAVASLACVESAQSKIITPAAAPAQGGPAGAAPQQHVNEAPVNQADVDFMSGMIPHHAQAVIMAGWAPTHGARSDVRILCERIVVGQRDEIELMQTWLRDRGQPVPDAKSTRMRMKMNGVEHDMLMPGMLTDEEMAALDKARGAEFDRLFLTGMIKHHQGAITWSTSCSRRTAPHRTTRFSGLLPTSTPISRPRSIAWRRCSRSGRQPHTLGSPFPRYSILEDGVIS